MEHRILFTIANKNLILHRILYTITFVMDQENTE